MSSSRFIGFEILWRVLIVAEGPGVLVVVSCCAVSFREVVLVEIMFEMPSRPGPRGLVVSFVLDCVMESLFCVPMLCLVLIVWMRGSREHVIWLYLSASGNPAYSTYSTYTAKATTGRRVSRTPPLGFGTRCGDLVVAISTSVIRGASPWCSANHLVALVARLQAAAKRERAQGTWGGCF
jgi:hypothetical protein